MTTSAWIWLILAVGVVKVLAGMLGLLFGAPVIEPDGSPLPIWTSAVQTVAFSAAGAVLLFANRRDRRAVSLGGFFLLTATAFSDRLLRRYLAAGQAASIWTVLDNAEVDAFLPAFLWRFAMDFPESRTSFRMQRIQVAGFRASVATGVLFFLSNIVAAFSYGGEGRLLKWYLSLVSRSGSGATAYYPVLLGLCLAALILTLKKGMHAGQVEQRRLRLFRAGLVAGLAPVSLDVLCGAAIPGFYTAVAESPVHVPYRLAIQLSLLSLPITTAYSVLVDRVLDMRLVVRQTLQYALARHSLTVAALIPFGGLLWYLYERRRETLSDLFAAPQPMFYLGAFVAGLAALRLRRRALHALDRRFFREQYDARRILSDVVSDIRSARNVRELATTLARAIDRALHVDSIAVLVRPASGRTLEPISGAVRPLPITSPLAVLVGGAAEPLDVDLDQPRSALRRLPQEQKEWLADGNIQLIVPMAAGDGTLLGLIALGEKKSELPFHAADRALLSAVAGSSALALERRPLSAGKAGRSPTEWLAHESTVTDPRSLLDEAAVECVACGLLSTSDTNSCADCGGPLAQAPVPRILQGKFRLERRVGKGGMGVVYRANDLVLDRPVAIKTMPRIQPERARRLRTEARAAAAITHPNLAQIFGAETWHGTPMLIFEFLDGGTLADRLARSLLKHEETLQLGLILADVLKALHSAGVLHGDIKPSNIGYRADGTLKLLDFGVSRLLHHTRDRRGDVSSGGPDETVPVPALREGISLAGGTIAYLSPEAVRGASPDPTFDLWSTAVVLWQALTGTNPFEAGSIRETIECIERGRLPDLRELRPDCPAGLAAFFTRALARVRAQRPSSAGEFGALLRQSVHAAEP